MPEQVGEIPTETPVPTETHLREEGQKLRLGLKAWALLLLVAGTAAACLVPSLSRLGEVHEGWLAFAVLGTLVAVAQLFPVHTPKNNAFLISSVFLLPAIFLVPLPLLALIPLVQHLPEWLKVRYPWQIEMFNISNHTCDLFAAWGAAWLVKSHYGDTGLGWVLAGVAAAGTYALLNHGLLATMLSFAKNETIRSTGVLSFESLSSELVLALLGFSVASFWLLNPWLVPVAFAPLLLIHRSLEVEALQEEARVDGKTGLYNVRHFTASLQDELARASRFDRPLSLIMADLDLLRDINNTYGHLAGDAVLQGIAEIFKLHLRHYDVPSRFGGEEFAILLPETLPEQAFEIAERIRQAVEEREFEVETSSEPIHATISIGIAGFPRDGSDPNELIHQADLAVYRAKLQGRNRVLDAMASESMRTPGEQAAHLVAVPGTGTTAQPTVPPQLVARSAAAIVADVPAPRNASEARHPRAEALHSPRFLSLSAPLATFVALVAAVGIAAGLAGVFLGSSSDLIGLLVVVGLVGIGQALALELDDGSISVSAVGALAGVALFGPRAALALAVATATIEWSARRSPLHRVLFNVGALSLASLAAAGAFELCIDGPFGSYAHSKLVVAGAGVAAGAVYFAVNMGLLSFALSLEGHERWWGVWQERFAWLLPHYLVYGFIGGVIAIAYETAHLYALGVFAVPLLLMRKTQEAYLRHTQKSTQKLREAADTIQTQNVSLERANRLLRDRSTAAMESLSATVDARDAYTAGHSRRVQQLALAIGRELELSENDLDQLGHAALFHDIGKLAIPDAILLKPAPLTDDEWVIMQGHAEEGARIIERLGFLNEAVPAIRHHHERFDGSGYPAALVGEAIPLGARIIHVADALDSMLTTRIYRSARPLELALEELRNGAGRQFCPTCVTALERIIPVTQHGGDEQQLRAAS